MNKKLFLLSLFAFLPLTACNNNPKPTPTVEKVKVDISCTGYARVNGLTNFNGEIDKDSDFTCTFSIDDALAPKNKIFILPNKGDNVNFLIFRDNQLTDDFTYELKENKKEATFKIKASGNIKITLNNFLTVTTFYCNYEGKTAGESKIAFTCKAEDNQATVNWGDESEAVAIPKGTGRIEHTYSGSIPEHIVINFIGNVTQISIIDDKETSPGNDCIESIDFSSYITHISAVNNYAKLENLVNVDATGITDIGDDTFKNNKSIQSCDLSLTIQYFGNNVFDGCTSLLHLNLSQVKTIPMLGSNVFNDCKAEFEIMVPYDLLNEFKNNEQWKPYSDHIKPFIP